jgi:hypothetical protein
VVPSAPTRACPRGSRSCLGGILLPRQPSWTCLLHAWFEHRLLGTSVVLGLRPDVGVRQVLVVPLTGYGCSGWASGCGCSQGIACGAVALVAAILLPALPSSDLSRRARSGGACPEPGYPRGPTGDDAPDAAPVSAWTRYAPGPWGLWGCCRRHPLARAVRQQCRRRRETIQITYPGADSRRACGQVEGAASAIPTPGVAGALLDL